MNTDVVVPLGFIVFVFLMVKLLINYQLAKQQKSHETLLLAIEKNKEIAPDVWKRFVHSIDPKKTDLRKGILFLGLAFIPLCLGLFAPFDDTQGNYAMLIIASVHSLLGLLYLYFWRFGHPS